MRLSELDPHWVNYGGNPPQLGVSFKCPITMHDHRILVPIIPGSRPGWNRTGKDFGDLTLTPSIHMMDEVRGPDGALVSRSTHWHGNIVRGEIIDI